jgi:protein TonB
MNAKRHAALPVQVDLAGLPAARLRTVLLAFASCEAAEVFDAQLADLHAEWLAAREHSSIRAAWLGLEIRAQLLTCVGYYACASLGVPALRTAAIIGIASYITFALFYGIATLILPRPMPREPDIEARKIVFTPLRRETAQPRRENPVKPVPPKIRGEGAAVAVEQPRDVEPPRDSEDPFDGGDAPAPPGLPAGPPPIVSSSECLPMLRGEPEYPTSALRRRIEGQVVVEMAIDRSGAVQNAEVLTAEPAGVFDDAVLRAVRRWRYRVSGDGDAGCDRAQVRLRFELARTR